MEVSSVQNFKKSFFLDKTCVFQKLFDFFMIMKQYNTQSTNKQTKIVLLLQRHNIHTLLGADHQQRTNKENYKDHNKSLYKMSVQSQSLRPIFVGPQMGVVATLKPFSSFS